MEGYGNQDTEGSPGSNGRRGAQDRLARGQDGCEEYDAGGTRGTSEEGIGRRRAEADGEAPGGAGEGQTGEESHEGPLGGCRSDSKVRGWGAGDWRP